MSTPTAAAESTAALSAEPGLWRWHPPAAGSLLAGITDRTGSLETLRARLPDGTALIQTQQVHGASLAAVEVAGRAAEGAGSAGPLTIPGCDGLATQTPGLGLIIRTADCLPIFAWDPDARAVALVHAGWRGLSRWLPQRLLRFLHARYHSRPERLWVGVGPAIRACCFEVGPEFDALFGAFVRHARGRRTCDLIGFAARQFARLGVAPSRIADSGRCTACEPARWHSHRRDGERGGRLLSFALLRP